MSRMLLAGLLAVVALAGCAASERELGSGDAAPANPAGQQPGTALPQSATARTAAPVNGKEKPMTTPPLDLQWEWPAERSVAQKLLVKIESIQADKGGLFAIRNSPSLVSGIPDPVILKGKVVHGGEKWQGREIALRLPQVELRGASTDRLAALGLAEDGRVCMFVEGVPDDVQETALGQWLASWTPADSPE